MPGKNLSFWRQGFPIFIGRPRGAMERLRAYGVRRGLDHLGCRKRFFLRLGMLLGWPVATLVDSVELAGEFSKITGRGWASGFFSLYGAALARNVPPSQHVRYARRAPGEPLSLADFLFPLYVRAFDALNRNRGANALDVEDKARFATICERDGLRHIRTIGVFRTGEPAPRLPEAAAGKDLFIKALRGKAGQGAGLWRADCGTYVSTEGRSLSAEALAAVLSGTDCIVQPVLRNCAALGLSADAALACLRIVTACFADGSVGIIAAAYPSTRRTLPSPPLAAGGG